MKQQYKIRLMTFLVATLLALTGLVAQSHSAFAGMNPPGGYPIRYSESTSSVPDLVDLTIIPHGISTSPGWPKP